MRQFMIVVLLFLVVGGAVAEDEANPQEGGRPVYFGAPVIKGTLLRGRGAFVFGGRGGWNVTPSLLLGGGAYGTITGVDAPKDAVPDAPDPLDIKFESFGIDLEYAVHPAVPTHPTVGLFLGGGAAHYVRDNTRDQHGETDFVLLLEPVIGVEQRLTDGLHLNLAISYRLVHGVEQPKLTNSDLYGPSAALAAKFGRF
jgi:hypothetical protein